MVFYSLPRSHTHAHSIISPSLTNPHAPTPHLRRYAAWSQRYKAAARSIGDRTLKMFAVAEELEQAFDLAGVTAIEDKLQDGVQQVWHIWLF